MLFCVIPSSFLHFVILSQDPAYNTGKFGEIKELIIGMLENYNYEEVTCICLYCAIYFGNKIYRISCINVVTAFS